MSGQLLVGEPERALSPHVRIRFTFADGGPDLRFIDQRTFGRMCLVRDGAELPAPIAHIAPDPFEAAFDPAALACGCARRRTGDQARPAGPVADQRRRQHLRRRGAVAGPAALGAAHRDAEARPEVSRLLAAVREVMGEALAVGGTSFDDLYVNVNGESGYFDRSLAVYGQEDRPCPRCGTPIRRDAFMNRSSFSCPHCQPRPRHPRL